MLDRQARNRTIYSCGNVSLQRGRPETEPGKECGHRLEPSQSADGKKPRRNPRPRPPLPGNGTPQSTLRGVRPGPVCCSGCPFGDVEERNPASTERGVELTIRLLGSTKTGLGVVGVPGNRARIKVAHGPMMPQRPPTPASSTTSSPTTSARRSCPILGAVWERRSAVRYGQTRSYGVNIAASTGLTCRNVPDRACCSPVLSVRDEGAAGSNPATPTKRYSHQGPCSHLCLIVGWCTGYGRREAMR
jgi:hypothetical protein